VLITLAAVDDCKDVFVCVDWAGMMDVTVECN